MKQVAQQAQARSMRVTKSSPELVAPSTPTPSARLPLSTMDFVRAMVNGVIVFRHGVAPAKVIKEALAKALVAYYPVAGRIVAESELAKPEVSCTGEGVWFVEASADFSLGDVNNLEPPLMVNEEELIFLLQVTEFNCGGFAMGVRFNHLVFDAIGAAQFLTAVADLARGGARPKVEPVWLREAISTTPQLSPALAYVPLAPTFSFEISMFDIEEVKSQIATATGQRCTTFEAVTAMFWQCRTRAVRRPPAANVLFGFGYNCRHLLDHLLPREGFYGNCVSIAWIRASGEEVAGGSIAEVVKLVRDAKERSSGEFRRWMEDHRTLSEVLRDGEMVVTDWRRVGFAEVDYGWGEPLHIAPMGDDRGNIVAPCIYMQLPKPKNGVRLMTRCAEKDQLPAFREEMSKFGFFTTS